MMTHILHRHIGHEYPVAASGRGIFIRDTNGKDYIDASGGAAVSCLGHSHPAVNAAISAQLNSLEYAHTSFFTTRVAEELADNLVAHAPNGIDHVLFVSGGSEAIEAALKLARQFFVERGELQRKFVIARRQSYHGVTLGALAVGGREWQRKPFAPLLIGTHHVSPVYEYRERRADEDPHQYGDRLARELESKIGEIGARNVIAFVAETVVGATMGAVPAVAGYFKHVRKICDRHGILLILDEVMCGMGRTGTLHACEQEGVSPDLMTIAKGMGGGFAPIGALLIGQRSSGRSRTVPAPFSTAIPIWLIRSLARPRWRCSRSSIATVCWPTCANRVPTCRADWASVSAITRMSVTSAGVGYFTASSWCLTAAPRNRSTQN